MTWALAVVDDGITNALQRYVGKPTAVEYDYFDGKWVSPSFPQLRLIL